jgi:hypothetical protein
VRFIVGSFNVDVAKDSGLQQGAQAAQQRLDFLLVEDIGLDEQHGRTQGHEARVVLDELLDLMQFELIWFDLIQIVGCITIGRGDPARTRRCVRNQRMGQSKNVRIHASLTS